MAQERRQLPNFQEYAYGALAYKFLNSNDEETRALAPSTLETLVGEKGLNLGEKAEGLLAGARATEKGTETAIEVYSQIFARKKGEYKPAELLPWYGPVFMGVPKEDKDKIVQYLSSFSETSGDIYQKYFAAKGLDNLNKANQNSKYNPVTEEQIDAAKKTMEKYQKVVALLQTLDRYRLESLRPEVINDARKRDLKGLASQL